MVDYIIKDKAIKDLGNYEKIEIRTLKEKSPNSILIYKNKVFFFIWKKNPTGILIKSKDIYENHKKHFLENWKKAKKSS